MKTHVLNIGREEALDIIGKMKMVKIIKTDKTLRMGDYIKFNMTPYQHGYLEEAIYKITDMSIGLNGQYLFEFTEMPYCN